jgi:GGDEF domain-containing protein
VSASPNALPTDAEIESRPSSDCSHEDALTFIINNHDAAGAGSSAELLRQAGLRLYAAKHAGRNQTT